MLKKDSLVRDLIAEAIRSVVDGVSKDHYDALTQEHQLTSRICQALEIRFNRTLFGRYRVRVVAQEMPDKGPNTLERKTGADIYVGIEIDDGDIVSKGFFVQAKWKETDRSSSQHSDLVKQCAKMKNCTHSAYVWLYGQNGVDVVPANEIINHPKTRPEDLGSRKLNEMMQQVLDCNEGDFSLGLPLGVPPRRSLKLFLQERGVRAGLVLEVKSMDSESDMDPDPDDSWHDDW